MTKRRRALPLVLAALLLTILPLAGCGQSAAPTTPPASSPAATTEAPTPEPTPVPTPTPTPRPAVTVRGMLPGAAPAGMDAVLAELNRRLADELSVTLELDWAAADKYDKTIETALASEAKPDFLWCAPSKLADYAGKGYIAPLDDLFTSFGADITKNIDAGIIDTMKIGGKLMGIPSSGNMPLKSGGQALVYREDLRVKYNLPKPDSIANMELYFSTIAKNEPGLAPLSSKTAALAAFWAAGSADMLGGTNGAVAYAVNEDGTVTCCALQAAETFKQAALKAREWYEAGYIPKAMLADKDPAAAVAQGKAAATTAAVSAVPALQDTLTQKAAGAALSVQPLAGRDAGYILGNGGNAICLTAAGASPDRTMEFINWIYASPANHDLLCYGIEGTHYTLDGDNIVKLGAGFGGFPSAMFENLNYTRFSAAAPDDYVQTVKAWNDGAAVSPLAGFAFDPAAVKDAAAKTKTVYANYSALMLSGSGDAETILAEFGAKMAAAGQDKVVAEAQKQVNAFIAAKQ